MVDGTLLDMSGILTIEKGNESTLKVANWKLSIPNFDVKFQKSSLVSIRISLT